MFFCGDHKFPGSHQLQQNHLGLNGEMERKGRTGGWEGRGEAEEVERGRDGGSEREGEKDGGFYSGSSEPELP